MDYHPATEIRERLYPQALTLVERATGRTDDALVEALLQICSFLEDSSGSPAPIVAVERDV